MQTLESFQIAFGTAINYLNRPLKKQRFTVIVVNKTAINRRCLYLYHAMENTMNHNTIYLTVL